MSPLDAQGTELVYPKVLDPQSNRPATIPVRGTPRGWPSSDVSLL